MPFIAMVAEIEPPIKPNGVELRVASYAHAAIMNLITSADSKQGKGLHDRQRNKHITLSLPRASHGAVFLRLTFFGDDSLDLAETTASVLSHAGALRLGQNEWPVRSIKTCNSPWAAVATWQDIVAPSGAKRVSFHFDTPTAFTKKDARGGRIMSLLPDPATLFSGLAWKWLSVGGEPLPDRFSEYISSGGYVVSSLQLRTVTARLPDRTQIGFLGSVSYTCRHSDQACISAINRLARLAFFTGVGYQVSRGMGSVRTKLHENTSEKGR